MRLKITIPAIIMALFFIVAQSFAASIKTDTAVKLKTPSIAVAASNPFQKKVNTVDSKVEKSTIKNSREHKNAGAVFPVFDHLEMQATNDAPAYNMSTFGSGVFYGIMLMIILVNLFGFAIFSDKVYGYFALAITSLAALIVSTDGMLSVFLEGVNAYSAQIETTLLVLSTLALSFFSAKFLNIKDYYPRLKSIVNPLLTLAGALTLVSWFIDNKTFMMAASIISFAVLCSYFAAGILLFASKNYAKFYVIGCSVPLLFSIDYFMLGGLGIHFLGTQAVHIKVAIGIQMLLMTYAIVYRMQAIKDETILRQTEMKIFLERQEAMSRDNLALMMQDVYLENLIMQYDLEGIEIKLLQYISEDKSNEKIARKLNTTVIEVEEMTKELYHKLEISEAIKEDYRMLEAQPDYLYN